MAYMLLGAVFLGVGAQASTIREIQMLSLPITILQVAMFGWASAAASSPGTWVATAAEIFPLSSPFAMAAHAANSPDLRSEEHTSELQSLMRISYAVFCLKKKITLEY